MIDTKLPNGDEINSCWAWKGDPKFHLEQAAVQAVEDGLHITPWTLIEVTCKTNLCMNTKHMKFHAPRKLYYPNRICIYCGRSGNTKDHLMPKAVSGLALRKYVLTVPACGECNNIINDTVAYSITERRRIAHAGIRKKYRKALNVHPYTDEEIEEFGHMLQTVILAGKHNKQLILERLSWPNDDTYDIRYLEQSGISDPYALGLITHVES